MTLVIDFFTLQVLVYDTFGYNITIKFEIIVHFVSVIHKA